MLWSRNEYIELMTFEKTERQMHAEMFGLSSGLAEEWSAQGAADTELSLNGFGFDNVARVDCGANLGAMCPPEPEILESGSEYTLEIDNKERIIRHSTGGGTSRSEVIDYPINTLDDWLAIKNRYAFHESRIDYPRLSHALSLQESGVLVVAKLQGVIDLACSLMGMSEAARSLVCQPELIRDIASTLTETTLRTLEIVTQKVSVDNLVLNFDAVGCSLCMISPDDMRKLLLPYYRAVWEFMSARGTRLFSLNTCCDVSGIAEMISECGINALYPCVSASGMDMVELRGRLGRKMAFKGGIDARVLLGSRADIDRELEYKLQPIMRAGGTCFSLDCEIPAGTPLEAYRYYVAKARKLLKLPLERVPMWGNMAF